MSITNSPRRVLVTASVAAISLLAAAGAAGQEQPFNTAQLFFELNATDGDLGLHAAVGGEPWKSLTIEDPNERIILSIIANGRLRRQGMSEFNFESAEPGFDEVSPQQFLTRFPAGRYELEAITLEGTELESAVDVSHYIPAAPIVFINGLPAAESCDALTLPIVNTPIRLNWHAVNQTYPDFGLQGGIKVAHYEAFVEQLPENGNLKSSLLIAPSNDPGFFAPSEMLNLGDGIYKFEILVRATNGNRTAVESCFIVQ